MYWKFWRIGLDDVELKVRAAVVNDVAHAAKILIANQLNAPFTVHKFNAFSKKQSIVDLFKSDRYILNWIDFYLQALDVALKQVKALSPETAAIFFSVDANLNQVVVLAAVPKVIGILFSNYDENTWRSTFLGRKWSATHGKWMDHLSLNGKGGGNAGSAQVTSTIPSRLAEERKATLRISIIRPLFHIHYWRHWSQLNIHNLPMAGKLRTRLTCSIPFGSLPPGGYWPLWCWPTATRASPSPRWPSPSAIRPSIRWNWPEDLVDNDDVSLILQKNNVFGINILVIFPIQFNWILFNYSFVCYADGGIGIVQDPWRPATSASGSIVYRRAVHRHETGGRQIRLPLGSINSKLQPKFNK